MHDGLYVALSSQVALEKRLTTLADNVANIGTVGFRATQVKFEELVSGPGDKGVSFVSEGGTYLSQAKGAFRNTGNMLDFAIRGDAWFALETPDGPIMTRDGRFTMQANGQIVSLEGYPVLDLAGAPMQVDPAAGEPIVSADGFMRQNGEQVGAIGLFTFEPGPDFRRYGNSGVVPVGEPEPLLDRADAGVVQGFVEDSNVNPVLEMTRLIMVQRAFESANALIRDTETSLGRAIETLGAG